MEAAAAKVWVLIILTFGGADGGRAIHHIEGFSEPACITAMNKFNALELYSVYGGKGKAALCVSKEDVERKY